MSGPSAWRLKRAPLVSAALLWGLACPAPAAAQTCDAAIVPITSALRLNYDPFAFTRTAGQLTFEVESRGDEACSAELVLLDASGTSVAETDLGDSGVRILLSGGVGDTPLTPSAVPGVWRVTLQPGRRTRLSLDALVTQDAVAGAGEHAAELLLELRDTAATAARTAPMPVRIVLATAARAQMNIVGAAATFGEGARVTRVDFGEMATGATRRVFLQVRANTGARLTIDSANRGRLVLPDAPEGQEGVPYSARLLDLPVDLTEHWEHVIDPPKTVAGASIPLDLVLGEVGGRPAGAYSDILNLELSAI